MDPISTRSATAPNDDGPDTYTLPLAEAGLAATLALMTGYAQSACERQRSALAHKIGAQLHALAQQGALSAAMRALAWSLHQHWQGLLQGSAQRLPQAPCAGAGAGVNAVAQATASQAWGVRAAGAAGGRPGATQAAAGACSAAPVWS